MRVRVKSQRSRTPFPRTSSPSLIEFPPQPGRSTRSPVLTAVGTMTPSLFGAPGPTAMTVASGKGLLVADDGRKRPVEVFYISVRDVQICYTLAEVLTVSALNRWTRTRSKSGTRDLMLLNVAWAAYTTRQHMVFIGESYARTI